MGFLEILICPDDRFCTGDEQSRIGVTVIHTLKMQITKLNETICHENLMVLRSTGIQVKASSQIGAKSKKLSDTLM